MWQSKIDFREREEINIHILVKNVASTDVLWIGHVFCDSGDMEAGMFLPQSSVSLCCCCPPSILSKIIQKKGCSSRCTGLAQSLDSSVREERGRGRGQVERRQSGHSLPC